MEIIRGDTGLYKFQRKDKAGEIILEKAEKIYFSVKENYKISKVLFQKTIDDMTFDEDGTYHFAIEASDTDNLDYGDYVYDLEVINGTLKSTISRGIFRIKEEVTFVGNEV